MVVPRTRTWLREPLVHFLLAGLLLFLVLNWLGGGDRDDVIVVDESTLVEVLRSRDPRLSVDGAIEQLRALGSETRSRLVGDVVREEVLYREALALGLDANDYAAKRRLVAQFEYLSRGIAHDSLALDEEDVTAHYERHEDRYRIPARVSFTHVFFATADDGAAAIEQANAELQWLNDNSLPFHESGRRGDHFLYHRNYVDESVDDVSAHFGAAFAESVFAFEAGSRWQGPLRSEHGVHLVLVASRTAALVPPLEQVRSRVAEDLARERVQALLDAEYEESRARYEVVLKVGETSP